VRGGKNGRNRLFQEVPLLGFEGMPIEKGRTRLLEGGGANRFLHGISFETNDLRIEVGISSKRSFESGQSKKKKQRN